MIRKNKTVLHIAVLFLLSFLLLLGVILLQLHSKELREEILSRKEMQAIEEKQEQTAITAQETISNYDEQNESTTSAILEIQKNENQPLKTYTTKPRTTKTSETTKKSTLPKTTKEETTTKSPVTEAPTEPQLAPVLSVNFKTKKIHGPNCPILHNTNPDNITEILREDVEEYLWEGYSFCSKCKGYAE